MTGIQQRLHGSNQTVLLTRDPMARYRRSTWSQVCSSHTIQLMDGWIFGAIKQRESVSWKNNSCLILSMTVSRYLRSLTYQMLLQSVFVPFYVLFSRTASLKYQSAANMNTNKTNESASCSEEEKLSILDHASSPDVLLEWPGQLRAHQQYSCQGPRIAPG